MGYLSQLILLIFFFICIVTFGNFSRERIKGQIAISCLRVFSTGKKYVCQKDPEIFERETETSDLVQYYYIVIIVIIIVNIHYKIYMKIKFRFRGLFWGFL